MFRDTKLHTNCHKHETCSFVNSCHVMSSRRHRFTTVGCMDESVTSNTFCLSQCVAGYHPIDQSSLPWVRWAYVCDEDENQMALGCWRQRCSDYPILPEMAKIYLAISPGSLLVESMFSTAGNMLNSKRSSVAPNWCDCTVVNFLVCTRKPWLATISHCKTSIVLRHGLNWLAKHKACKPAIWDSKLWLWSLQWTDRQTDQWMAGATNL